MRLNARRVRQLHASLVPFVALPLLLTLVTGMFYQLAALNGQGSEFLWLLALHRGQFGPVNLEGIYPFLNALGLLTLLITGSLMWWRVRSR